jgi:pimeloyl-ACP methyl ester carboxylesterase
MHMGGAGHGRRRLRHNIRRKITMTVPSNILTSGSGTPVVALHSSMSSKSQWTLLSERLARHYKFIAIDLSGYGRTPFPRNSSYFSLHDEVALIDDTLKRLIGEQTRFHLIGHSYGGGTALRLAHEQPRRLLTMSLYEPTPFCLLEHKGGEREELQAIIDTIARLTRMDARAATRVFIDYWNFPGSFNALPEERQQALMNRIEKVNLDFRALISDPLTLNECRSLDFPVCLIAGRKSLQPPRRIVELLHAALPDSIRYEVDAGHMGPITHADEVNTIFSNFLDHHERWHRLMA